MPCEYTIRGAGVAVSEEVQDPSRCGDPSPYDAENDMDNDGINELAVGAPSFEHSWTSVNYNMNHSRFEI